MTTISPELREAFEALYGDIDEDLFRSLLNFISEREVMARKEEREIMRTAIEDWTPHKLKQLMAGGGSVMPTLDDHKRNFAQEILALLTQNNKDEV